MNDYLNLDQGYVLRIYKPLHWTSYNAVKKIQRLIIRKLHRVEKDPVRRKRKVKVGHAGTLDPLATGLLLVCVGKETRNIERYIGLPKTYTGTFCLGATRPSDDKETEVDWRGSLDGVTSEQISEAANALTGRILQVPPAYSAIKTGGNRAYHLVRAGKEVKLEAREVWVEYFKITGIHLPYIDFEISCSKGTYIRSLARDFGKRLSCGAYLESLCRTRIGDFDLNQAVMLEELAETFGEPLQLRPPE